MDIIQRELDLVVQEWGAHRITKSKNSISPSGRPIVMYNLPELYGSEDNLVRVFSASILSCKEECLSLKSSCDEDVNDLCNIILSELDMSKPHDPYDAVNLYVKLRTEILDLL
ncbi:uncharacterized protein LOC116176587 [Photinus pyralis]|uniref:uncharacterized protein LOC116176577 n=1 Tax=Photinus pyralis TaxID=7054 RepID=UPI0012675E9A|nr:uncharacterized protein LOC116176577 [Photinus pyralis]XP_031351082.1 uncharacterized protein LOC116176587 [Photinus pyralis]